MAQPPYGFGGQPGPTPQAEPPVPQAPQPPGAGALDTLIPTNPLAAVACWTGILSVIVCGFGVVLGPIALVTGVLSLKRGTLVQQSGYGKATSKARSWIGIVTGALGTLVSLVFILLQLFGKR